MSFENFPYTNFHELNLDWIIQKVKEAYGPDNPPENLVISVNGESGEVILYKDAIVRLPDVEEGTWNIHRVADNTSSGIEFDVGDSAKRIDGLNRYEMYDEGNPPPYPVRSVNGQTGNVIISIPVTSVNGMTGAVTLYPNAVIAFPDVEASVWNMGRGSDGKLTGIQFIKDSPAQRMNGNDRYDIYDSGNPPPYPVKSINTLTGAVAILDTTIVTDQGTQKIKITFPVTSVDGQTGAVSTWAYTNNDTLKTPVASSEANVWQLVREIPSGDAGIRFEYDSTDDEISGYLVFDDGINTPLKLKILTPTDIPSSSGVVSINGLNGIVTLTGSNIHVSSTDSRNISNVIGNIENNVAYIETSTTASRNYTVGDYIVVAGVLKKVLVAISSGDTINNINTETTTIGEQIDNLNDKFISKEFSSVTTITFTLSNSSQALLIITGSDVQRSGIVLVRIGGTGSVYLTPINLGTSITVNGSANTITVSSSSTTSSTANMIILNGSAN